MSMNEREEKADDCSGIRGQGWPGEKESLNQGTAYRNSQESRSSSLGQSKGAVYFIETEDGRYIKIGYSNQAHRRIWQLGTLRPSNYALHLLGNSRRKRKEKNEGEKRFRRLRRIRQIYPQPPRKDSFVSTKTFKNILTIYKSIDNEHLVNGGDL
jgi:hypothetical protein